MDRKSVNYSVQDNQSLFLQSGYLRVLTQIVPLLFFVVMMLVVIFNRPIGDYGVETDFYSAYVDQAKELLNGNLIIDDYRGPFYQIVLALFGILFNHDFFLAGKILNVTCAGITLVFVFKLIERISNSEIALFAGLFVAVNLNFIRYSYMPGTDILFMMLYISALYFILKSSHGTNKDLVLAGVFTSLAYLTRYTGISLILFALIFLVFQFLKGKKSDTPRLSSKKILMFILPLIFFLGSWSIYSHLQTGQLFHNKNYLNTAMTIHKPDEISKDEWTLKYQNEFGSMYEVVTKDLSKFLERVFAENLPGYLYKDLTRLFPRIIGLLAGLGLLLFLSSLLRKNELERGYLLASFLFYCQLLLIFYSERFSLPLVPFYSFMIVSLFSYKMFQSMKIGYKRIRIFGIVLATLLIYNFLSSYSIIKNEINEGPAEILQIRKDVEQKYDIQLQGKSVMARKPHIAYYLNMEYQVTPYVESYQELLKVLKDSKVSYYFVNEKEAESFENKDIRNLLLHSTPQGLEVVSSTDNPKAFLYEVK